MNKYEILDMIDEGAYGIVWKALNRESGSLGTDYDIEWQLRNSRIATRMNSHVRTYNVKLECLNY